VKRALDVAVAIAGLVALAPAFAVIGLLVKLDSRGRALFRAPRVGRHGRIFLMLKFRTMTAGITGPAITTSADARVTRFGAFLRRTRLDEMPQLWNVLVGEMSLVGPRPEDPRFAEAADATWQRVLSVRPGITGPAQLEFADREQRLLGEDPERDYRERVLPAKLRVDAAYVDARSFAGDLRLLFRTALRVAGAR
jgi:lipopolysaccharide/colanic/teichoic acid biosynthesis glycosyltransferase